MPPGSSRWAGATSISKSVVVQGREYGVWRDGGTGFHQNPRHVRLADPGLRVRERFLYEYDFSEGWDHDAHLELVRPPSQIQQHVETGAHFACEHKVAVLTTAGGPRAQADATTLQISKATDQELLGSLAFHL